MARLQATSRTHTSHLAWPGPKSAEIPSRFDLLPSPPKRQGSGSSEDRPLPEKLRWEV